MIAAVNGRGAGLSARMVANCNRTVGHGPSQKGKKNMPALIRKDEDQNEYILVLILIPILVFFNLPCASGGLNDLPASMYKHGSKTNRDFPICFNASASSNSPAQPHAEGVSPICNESVPTAAIS